jgi:hypothetical protein
VLATLRMSRDHLSFHIATACVGTAASDAKRSVASHSTSSTGLELEKTSGRLYEETYEETDGAYRGSSS